MTNKRPKTKSPLRLMPLRDPGQSLHEQLLDLVYGDMLTWATVALFAILLAGLEWLRQWQSWPPSPVAASVVAALVCLVAVVRICRAIPRVREIRLGVRGERLIGQCLEQLRAYPGAVGVVGRKPRTPRRLRYSASGRCIGDHHQGRVEGTARASGRRAIVIRRHERPVFVALAIACLTTSALGADWPQFHGPNRDNISRETGLLKKWPEGGPKLLWTAEGCGLGFSGPAIAGGMKRYLPSGRGIYLA